VLFVITSLGDPGKKCTKKNVVAVKEHGENINDLRSDEDGGLANWKYPKLIGIRFACTLETHKSAC
jgi:hypothetical protein